MARARRHRASTAVSGVDSACRSAARRASSVGHRVGHRLKIVRASSGSARVRARHRRDPRAASRTPAASRARRSRPVGHSAVSGPLSSRMSITARASASTSVERGAMFVRDALAQPAGDRLVVGWRRRSRRADAAEHDAGQLGERERRDVVAAREDLAPLGEVLVEQLGGPRPRSTGRRRARRSGDPSHRPACAAGTGCSTGLAVDGEAPTRAAIAASGSSPHSIAS